MALAEPPSNPLAPVTCRLQLAGHGSRRSQPPLALSVPLSRFTPRVGGGSAFFVRPLRHVSTNIKYVTFVYLVLAPSYLAALFDWQVAWISVAVPLQIYFGRWERVFVTRTRLGLF